MPFSLDSFAGIIPAGPVQILQLLIVVCAVVLVYLLLFTLRDILLRTRSFWYQFFCVLLVGCLPLAGFLLYLLIRPARTVKERETERMLRAIAPDAILEETSDEELDELIEAAEDDSTPSV